VEVAVASEEDSEATVEVLMEATEDMEAMEVMITLRIITATADTVAQELDMARLPEGRHEDVEGDSHHTKRRQCSDG